MDATLKQILVSKQKNPNLAVLLLIPQSLLEKESVRTFVHAYAERGETYRQGPLFRKIGSTEWLQLNQAVHEFWVDPDDPLPANLTKRQQVQLKSLLAKYKDQVGDANSSATARQKQAEGNIPYVRLPVKPGCEPASEPPFKKNPKVRQLTIDFVRDMEKRGLVSRCTAEEAVFVCNSLMLPKTKDKYRFVCTFSSLNANMVKDPYGMRTLDAVLTALEGSSWFSVLDVVDGFFNLPLYPADRGYTAFHTPIGVYKWNVLPQGTAASPQIFQRMMDKFFSAYLWKSVIVWVDDILVHSATFQQHMQHLEQVLQVAKSYGLVFNKQKLMLCQRTVRYIGYVFGINGISTDPDKVAAVHDIPAPKNPKEVRQLLGFAGFYRRFMPPAYADTIAPLTDLTKKDRIFKWTPECEASLQKIKLWLTTTPVLAHPDFSLPFHVHCDACGKGVGAVLSQYVNGAYRPIAFCSKRLLPHQLHWAPAQLEAFAVYYAVCVKWRYYLSLNKTVIHTDHRNLSWLFRQSQKGLIGRWYAHLCAYDLDITYVQGKTQVVADPLSRLLKPTPSNPEWTEREVDNSLSQAIKGMTCTLTNATKETVMGTVYGCPAAVSRGRNHDLHKASNKASERSFDFLHAFMGGEDLACKLKRETWSQEQRKDLRLAQIFKCLEHPEQQKSLPKWARKAAQSHRIIQGVLHYRAIRKIGAVENSVSWLVTVPASLKNRVIHECHQNARGGHRGVTKTLLAIRQRYHVKGLRKSVLRMISKCAECIKAKTHQLLQGTPLTPVYAPDPFNAIAMDLYKPGVLTSSGYRYVLTVVDLCTRWVQFFPLRSKYAAEVMLALCHGWFVHHGVPEFILSDNGKEFLGVVSTVCTACDIKQMKTTPGHPQANGLCEGQHRTLTRELRIRSAQRKSVEWDNLLPEIHFAMNVTTDDDAPGISPFQLVFGRRPRLAGRDVTFPSKVMPAVPPKSKEKREFVSSLCNNLQGIRLTALNRQLQRKQRAREKHDRQRGVRDSPQATRGDIVHIHHKTAMPKLQYQWTGPTWLVLRADLNTCKLKSLTSATGRKGGPADTKTVNQKNIRIASPRPEGIGARIRRQFKGDWFLGTITDMGVDQQQTWFVVDYDDGDQQDMDVGEIWDNVCYHPRMDERHYAEERLPGIDKVVVFAFNQQLRLGMVTNVNGMDPKPLSVALWKPHRKATSLQSARYRPSMIDGHADLVRLSPIHIKLKGLKFNEEGYLDKESKHRLSKYTRQWKHLVDGNHSASDLPEANEINSHNESNEHRRSEDRTMPRSMTTGTSQNKLNSHDGSNEQSQIETRTMTRSTTPGSSHVTSKVKSTTKEKSINQLKSKSKFTEISKTHSPRSRRYPLRSHRRRTTSSKEP